MVVWRRWIFPILLVLVFGLIAASLTKLAFFSSEQDSPISPNGMVTDPVVLVETGSVVNELLLTGKIARDADVAVRSSVTGLVTKVEVSDGANVAAGDVLFTVKQEYPVQWVDIVAPEAGKLGELGVVVGQDVAVGAEVTKLTPNRFHILATVEPVQLYRLLDAPSEAQVTITGGPAPFACTGLATQVSEDGTTSVTCSIPADQVVFPGLPAELSIAVGTADEVLTIPATAVKGGAGSGVVWLEDGSGEPTETKVTLGVSDGTLVEVTEGLSEGDEIRQFVPGSAAPVEEYCYEIAPGEEYCETGVSW
ncbi:MAG: efflux RND transporter periplasmic adaptor subunit [Leucobacter sp.]